MKLACARSVLVSVVILVATAVAAQATILNPSFEDSSPPADWTVGGSAVWGVDRTFNSVNGLPTDGSYSGRIFSKVNQSVTAGQFGSLSQVVDLTNIASITFDASLDQFESGAEQDTWWSALEAVFLIDAVDYWTASSHGAHLGQTVDTSGLTGTHTIEFQNRALATATPTSFTSNWFMFDHMTVVLVPEPTTALLLTTGLGLLGASRRGRSREAE